MLNLYIPKLCAMGMCSTHVFIIMLHSSTSISGLTLLEQIGDQENWAELA